ncbi:hypothetical protein HUU62_15255 [Rhodoferax sp. 4810]|nr:hypothetical protein [Rhodoferax jenense]
MMQSLIAKLNVKSGLLAISGVLCVAGLYMCITGLQTTGSIDIKSVLLEGKISTGSLGLLVIFLAIPLALAAKKVSLREKHVEIFHGDLRVTAANMCEREWSYIVDCVKEHEGQHSKLQSLSAVSKNPSQ